MLQKKGGSTKKSEEIKKYTETNDKKKKTQPYKF